MEKMSIDILLLFYSLRETCNNLVGMLFRVEAATKAGLTNPACTSLPNSWVIPAPQTVVKLGEVNSFDFVQPCAGKRSKYLRPLQIDYCVDVFIMKIIELDRSMIVYLHFFKSLDLYQPGKWAYNIYI